jgi:hypothetical protein
MHIPFIYNIQEKVWMTAELFKDRFFINFVPTITEKLRKQGLPQYSKAMFLLDNCNAYTPDSELVCGNIFALHLPANLTPFIHTMNQDVIQSFSKFIGELSFKSW